MLRATSIVRKPAVKADRVVDTVTLDHEERQRRRAVLKGASGLELMVDLEKATMLNEGDALRLEDGRLVAVRASEEALLEIRAENPLRLARVAWHIGNRHTPAEITEDAIFIGDDHVLAEMVRGQGCSVAKVRRPFRPEQGAYAGGHAHDHGHGHGHHGHDHHGHAHEHEHDHGHDHHGHDHGHHAHAHGADCGCGHDHHHHHEHTHDVLDVASAGREARRDHGHDHHHHGHDHGHGVRHKHDH